MLGGLDEVVVVVKVSAWICRSVQRCWCSRLCFTWRARLSRCVGGMSAGVADVESVDVRTAAGLRICEIAEGWANWGWSTIAGIVAYG